MSRNYIGRDVFSVGVDRMETLYAQGHRILISFSAGKDSGTCLEVCLIAARKTGRLPVEVVMRDEEVMYPGTYEYAERVAARPEVKFHWIYACQPIINVFNRQEPFFWVFDPALKPEAWVRRPPDFAVKIPDLNIERMVTPDRFPPAPGKELLSVIGIRGQESSRRLMAIHSSRGYITGLNGVGIRQVRPIYDWTDGDVWKAHADHGWDYNKAYDTMYRMGVPRRHLRIAPPTMNVASVSHLKMASEAWPKWFDAVCRRLPGVRTAAHFGARSVQPVRHSGESWEECFRRVCLQEAPEWIRDRAQLAMQRYLTAHAHHSTQPLPEVTGCEHCTSGIGSWRRLCLVLYNGDPFCMSVHNILNYVEPEFFRKGAGTWGGKPAF